MPVKVQRMRQGPEKRGQKLYCLAVTAADTSEYVNARADLVLKCGGGQGAFRELADRLLLERINTDLLPEKERL